MTPRAYLICGGAHTRDVVRFEQERTLLDRHAFTRKHAIENGMNVHWFKSNLWLK
jgi:hypothetical protein